MSAITDLEHRYVDVLPPHLVDGVLYVSMDFNTVVHRCCCGCGARVVTPLSPAGWQLQYDGRSITLFPSIGNHQYGCRSHYWIRENRVVWSYACSSEEIEASRGSTLRARMVHYDSVGSDSSPNIEPSGEDHGKRQSWWSLLREYLR